MTLQVVFQRVGSSTVSEQAIPLVAHVRQGGRFGENLLARERVTDIEGAKALIYSRLIGMLGHGVVIEWIDHT